jgi:uncharacterized protein (TIGR03000 family)
MRPHLAVIACFLFLPSLTRGGEPLLPDGSPLEESGGLIIMRRGNQTTLSLGGVALPRKVRVTIVTPEGPVVTRFTLPSNFHSPTMPPWLGTAPATLQVDLPDTYGHLYIEGQRAADSGGLCRLLESPPLPPGQTCAVRLTAVFQVGNRIVVEDRQVILRAGERTALRFDGNQPTAVVPANPGK